MLAGVLSLAITAVVCCGGYWFLRRESAARWVGAKAQRPLSWVLIRLKRKPIEDGPGQAGRLREQVLLVVRTGWKLGSAGVAANLLLTYLILFAALRFVGVSGDQLSGSNAFEAFAIAFWAGAVVPITGSGLGVVDAVMLAMLVESSSAPDDVLLAAVLLWRVFYSVVALPLGALTFARLRREPGPEPGSPDVDEALEPTAT